MNKMYSAILTLAAFSMLVPAHADDTCLGVPTPEVTIPDVTGELGGDLYVDNDFCQLDGCDLSIWVYQETNGHAGLQRGDEVENDVANCVGIEADTDII